MFDWIKKLFEKRNITSSQYPWMTAPRTSAGVVVNESTALNLSAVWCAINCIASELASLACKVYKEKEEEREAAHGHPIYDLLVYQPNEEMTPITFFETMQSYLLRYGNAYAEIERSEGGKVKALWPLHPSLINVERTTQGIIYKVSANQNAVYLNPDSVLHISGPMGDGIVGASPIQVARESLGLCLGIEKYGSGFFGNAVRPSGIIQTAGRLTEQARANIRQSIEYSNSQPSNSARLMILEEGLTFNPFTFNNEEFQFLESRRFQIEEIARWFSISPLKLRNLSSGTASYHNLSVDYQDFYDSTLRPWCIRWEQELERKLLSNRERFNYFIEFDYDSVLRADPETRYKIYQLGIQSGILTVDECRAKENLNPMEEEEKESPAMELQETQVTGEIDNGDQGNETTNPTGQPQEPATMQTP